jgi:Carboxypeptidase regulatory-like domain
MLRDRKLAILVFIALAAAPLMAQIGGTGTIQGVVSDPSGAVVPGATVTATNEATEVKTTRQTTVAGYYVIAPLPAGRYTVAVSAGGFQNTVQERVVVDALGTVGLNLALRIGSSADSVTVTDTPPEVNTSDARVGQTVRNELYTALPLAMGNAPRDPTSFVQYMPGVAPGGSNAAGQVFGAQANTQDVYVEGLPATNSVVEGEVRNVALGISVEAVEQFQLESGGAPVQYGGMGSTNFVLKSGTNKFHGGVYEIFRNTLLDARGFFAATRPAEHQNEFGFNLSGPIRKNRIFFFGSYDGFRYRTGTAPTLVTVPTLKQRAGDFSELSVAIYDPLTLTNVNGINARQIFPNNKIPANQISAASKAFQAALPEPTYPGLQSNYLGSLPTGFNNTNTTNKVDFNLNERNTVFVLYSRGHRSQSNSYRGAGNSLPLPYTDTRLVNEVPTTAQLRHTLVLSPTLINQVSFGFSRLWVPIYNATIEGDWMNKAGVKGLPAGEAASSFPEISFAGPNSVTGWRGTNSRAFTEAINNFTVQDNVQWTRGSHALTLGFQLQRLQANELTNAYGSLATWSFSNTQTEGFNASGTPVTTTGNSYASYLLGGVNSANVDEDSVVGTGARYRDYAWWVQDNYKVSPRLTLNIGVRHDIMLPYVEVKDRQSFFNPDLPNPAAGGRPGILMFSGNGPASCGCRTTVETHWKNFGPRLGFAFSMNRKTVLRGGYTIMYTHRGAVGGRGGARTGTGTLGFSANPNYTSLDAVSPAFYWDNGLPAYKKPPFFDPTLGTAFNGITATGSTMQFGDPQLGGHPPYYQNWNFAIERAITSTMSLTVNYVGSNGHFQGGGGRSIWSDQINPKYLGLGNLLTQQATAANVAAASRIFPEVALPFSSFTGTIAQMLRPFPQYPGVSDLWGDVANDSYNSVQVIVNKRLSHGLTFNGNYFFAKSFSDDTGSRSAYNWVIEKAQQTDPSHTVNLLLVYAPPFGKGQRWGAGSKAVDLIAGHWQISSITTYRSGSLFGTIGASCNTPSAGSCYADYNASFTGPVRINGAYGSGDVRSATYLDLNAFKSPAPYTYGTTPRTGVFGLRGPSNSNESVSLRREFPIHETMKLAFVADALNVFNMVRFAMPNLTITNANYGRITGVANSPRVVQFSLRLTL